MMKAIVLLLMIHALISCKDKRVSVSVAAFDRQLVTDFVQSLYQTTEAERLPRLDSFLETVSSDSSSALQTFDHLQKVFGDPNSPYRNETLYSHLLQEKLKSSFTDSASKIKTRERLYLLMQNRVGSAANDFIYLTASGSKKKMYAVKASYTLLYFYNPECDACKQMKAALLASSVIGKAVGSGELKVLAIYTDKDEKVWLDHLDDMPSPWIHGRDENEYLYQNHVYDLRAIPTLYLLDQQKNVLLKDAMNVSAIEELLSKDRP